MSSSGSGVFLFPFFARHMDTSIPAQTHVISIENKSEMRRGGVNGRPEWRKWDVDGALSLPMLSDPTLQEKCRRALCNGYTFKAVKQSG